MNENITNPQNIEQEVQKLPDSKPEPIILKQSPAMQKDEKSHLSQEQLFKKLNTTVSHALSVVKWVMWPAVLLFVAFAGYLGFSTNAKLGQIDELKKEITEKRDAINDTFYKVKDQSYSIIDQQKTISDEQIKVSEQIVGMNKEIEKLGTDTKNVSNRGLTLIKAVENANFRVEDLLSQTDLRLNEQKNYLDNNRKAFETAREDIKNKEALVEKLKKEYETEIDKIKKVNSLFVEYQVLIAKGRNIFPDPNLYRENEILNQIAGILYPDLKDREDFIRKMNNIPQ